MCLDLILGCILTFSEGSVKPLIQEAFAPSALEPSALCFWSLTQNTDEALSVDAPGCAVCHWGCGLGPTEAVSLPPPHSLCKLLSARNPCPGSAGDGDRKRQRHRRERGTPSGYFTDSHTSPAPWLSYRWRAFQDATFPLEKYKSCPKSAEIWASFQYSSNFSAFSTMQFVAVAVAFSKGWSFFPPYRKKPFPLCI